jgi:hypothetical protein
MLLHLTDFTKLYKCAFLHQRKGARHAQVIAHLLPGKCLAPVSAPVPVPVLVLCAFSPVHRVMCPCLCLCLPQSGLEMEPLALASVLAAPESDMIKHMSQIYTHVSA